MILRYQIVLDRLLTFYDLLFNCLHLLAEVGILLPFPASLLLVLPYQIYRQHGCVYNLEGELGLVVGSLLVLVDEHELLVVALFQLPYFLFLDLLLLQQLSNLRVGTRPHIYVINIGMLLGLQLLEFLLHGLVLALQLHELLVSLVHLLLQMTLLLLKVKAIVLFHIILLLVDKQVLGLLVGKVEC